MTRAVSTTLLLVLTACLAVFLGADATLAQWSGRATASMGRSYGNLTLSQSILSGTRRLGDAAPSSGSPPALTTPAQTAAALNYAADPQHSERIRAQMIEIMSRSDAALRADLEKAFADNAVLKEFDRIMSASGYSSRNVADDMSVLLRFTWETFSGGTASKAEIKGIRQQVLGIFLSTPRLRAMTNAERQDMAERIAYHIVLGTLARDEAVRSGDPARLTQVRQSAAATLQAHIGIDMSQLRLTERGFFKKL
jgi:hypothetical protein